MPDDNDENDDNDDENEDDDYEEVTVSRNLLAFMVGIWWPAQLALKKKNIIDCITIFELTKNSRKKKRLIRETREEKEGVGTTNTYWNVNSPLLSPHSIPDPEEQTWIKRPIWKYLLRDLGAKQPRQRKPV